MPIAGSVDTTALETPTAQQLETVTANLQSGLFQGWTSVIPIAASFFATTGVWSVSPGMVRAFRHAQQGALLAVNLKIIGSTTGAGMGSVLYVRLPQPLRILPDVGNCGTVWWSDGATTAGPGTVRTGSTVMPEVLELIRDSQLTAWPSAATVDLSLSALVPVY